MLARFTRSTLIRALRTAAQTALASIGSTAMIEAVDWRLVASTTALATIASVLTSVATGLPEDDGQCLDCDENPPHGSNPELDQ